MLGNKQSKGEDGKMLKPTQILKPIMDAWNVIINSSTKKVIYWLYRAI